MSDTPIEDLIGNSEEFQDAIRRANLGVYEHTILEHWSIILDEQIAGTSSALTMPLVDSMLRTWPYLSLSDIPSYLKMLNGKLVEIKDVLDLIIGDDRKKIFSEIDEDGSEHKELYKQAIGQWNALTNFWAEEWISIPLKNEKTKLIALVANSVATSIVHGQTGLVGYLGNLAGLNMTEEDERDITAIINGEARDE